MMKMNNYISIDTAIEKLNRLERESHHNSVLWPDHVEECREAIRDIPAADVRPVVRGEWERPKGYTPRSWIFVCSKCGDRAYFPVPKYFPKGCGYSFCPNCGADMRPSANDEKEV
jgi:rRNA maturation protein Nop10